MNKKRTDVVWLGVSVFFFLMLSISFLLMPIEGGNPEKSLSGYGLAAGAMFWLSIIMMIVTQSVLARRRKSWCTAHRIRKSKMPQKIGLISFFKNGYAIIADVVTVISLAGFIIAMFATQGTGYICYVFASLFVFSFSMHCVLNGKVYYYIVNKDKMLKAIEKERANSSKQERKE